jgi:hypothetical protein
MLTCEFDVRPPVDPQFADYTDGWLLGTGFRDSKAIDFETSKGLRQRAP